MGNALRGCMRGGCEVVHHDDESEGSAAPMILKSNSNASFRTRKMIFQQQQHHHQRQQQQLPLELKPAMEILPSSQEGVVRVKLIISTHQMANMINASYKKDDFLESLITSLLREKGINMPEPGSISKKSSSSNSSSSSSSSSCGGSWKPALESIPEAR